MIWRMANGINKKRLIDIKLKFQVVYKYYHKLLVGNNIPIKIYSLVYLDWPQNNRSVKLKSTWRTIISFLRLYTLVIIKEGEC